VIGVLATPGTAKRGYTHELIDVFAGDCHVVLCPSDALAEMAEAKLAGVPVDMARLAQEVAPAFVTFNRARTDVVVLACTHYPFLLDELMKAAPWEVNFIDPAPAIARRTAEVLEGVGPHFSKPDLHEDKAIFTRQPQNMKALGQLLEGFGLLSMETILISDV
jgi:glutamate racemase